MSIEVLSSGASSAGDESFSFSVDYDTVAETIGLTCTGTGHSTLAVIRTINQASLGSLICDQYGTDDGSGNITYSGSRVIVLGPGATGVDSQDRALPTTVVPSAVVGTFNVPKGQTPGLGITLTWGPNSFSSKKAPVKEESLSEFVKRCIKHSK